MGKVCTKTLGIMIRDVALDDHTSSERRRSQVETYSTYSTFPLHVES